MIFQLTNILGGTLLYASHHKKLFVGMPGGEALLRVSPHEDRVGLVVFILGVVALLERVNVLSLGISGSSFPQALPAILIGLSLGSPLMRHASMVRIAKTLEPYRSVIGIAGVLSGLGSLLFGCVLPLVCSAPFGI